MFEVDRERAGKVEEYIETHVSEFSIVDFMEKHNLFESRIDKGDSVNSKCPFHADKNPSFFVSVSKNRFNCFSCNKNGGYLRFLTVYKNELEHQEVSYYDVVDMVLKRSQSMQAFLGFNSIFRSQFELVKEYRRLNYKFEKNPMPYTYTDLYEFMKLEGFLGEEHIKYAILSMQLGKSPKNILSVLRVEQEIKDRLKDKNVSIEDILNEDD